MRHGAKRTAESLHTALSQYGTSAPAVLGVSINAIDRKLRPFKPPQDVLLDLISPVSRMLIEGAPDEDVQSTVKKALKRLGLKLHDFNLFHDGFDPRQRPAWLPPPADTPACANMTPASEPTNLYKQGGVDELASDALERIDDLEDLDLRGSDVGVCTEAREELFHHASDKRIVQIVCERDDDDEFDPEGEEHERCRAVALAVCESFLAEERFQRIWRVAELNDLEMLRKLSRKDDGLLLWVDVCSPELAPKLEKKLDKFLDKYTQAKAVLTAPTQEPWSELDAKLGYTALSLDAGEDETAASGYHDDLEVTPLDAHGQPCNPLEFGYSAEEIKAFLNTALTEHKLAGAFINDDGKWIFRIGLTDIAQLHRLRQKVLEGTSQNTQKALEGALVQLKLMQSDGVPSPPPSPPPLPPLGTPAEASSGVCASAMRLLCGACLGPKPIARAPDEDAVELSAVSLKEAKPNIEEKNRQALEAAARAGSQRALAKLGALAPPQEAAPVSTLLAVPAPVTAPAAAPAAVPATAPVAAPTPAPVALSGMTTQPPADGPTDKRIYWRVDQGKFVEMWACFRHRPQPPSPPPLLTRVTHPNACLCSTGTSAQSSPSKSSRRTRPRPSARSNAG